MGGLVVDAVRAAGLPEGTFSMLMCDGKDVGHKTPLRKGGGNARANLAVQSRKFNRGWEAGGRGR